jgi:hypothetical protein
MKSRRIRRAGGVARMGKKRNIYIGFVWGNAKDREHLQAIGVDGS